MTKLDKDIIDTLSDTFSMMDQACSALSMAIQVGIDRINELRHDAGDDPVNPHLKADLVNIMQDIHNTCTSLPGLLFKGRKVRHYKGGRYTIKGVGIHEATLEPMVAYEADDKVVIEDGIEIAPTWFRPMASFLDFVVDDNGRTIPRFTTAPTEDATTYPSNIAPVESRRDFAILEPPFGHHVDASVVAKPEQVMAIPSALVTWEGLKCENARRFLEEHVYPTGKVHFPDKADAEQDLELKQIIPYVVIRSGTRFAVFQRTKGTGDQRLKGKVTIGVGGHVNFDDHKIDVSDCDGPKTVPISNEAMIRDGMIRELNEEVPELWPHEFSSVFTGLMNWSGEEDNGVGKYHLGLVYQVTLNTPIEFKPKDQGLIFLGWWTGAQLHRCMNTGRMPETYGKQDEPATMEMWTRLMIDSGIVPETYN